MSFKLSDLFDPNCDFVNVWPNLTSSNIFDKKKSRFSGKGYYEAALRLISIGHYTLLPNSQCAIHHEIWKL